TEFTVTFPGLTDLLDENDETYELTIGGVTATGTITDDDTAALSVTKTQIGGLNPVTAAGQIITYEIVVENTGSAILTNVVVSDDLAGSATLIGGDDVNPGVLDIGEIWTYSAAYTVTQNDIDSGLDLINTASVTTFELPTPLEDSASTGVSQTAELTVTKTADVTTYDAVDDVITYTITVQNTGNVTLTNVSVTDPLTGLDETIASLAPGVTETYTTTYTITQADLDAGSVENTATATDGTTTGSDTETVTADELPELTVTKTADVTTYDAVDDVITYTITVQNTGNVTLTNVSVTD
ncbi:DUF7507 domain-containing protein, partial [Algoriphagus limi]|nr:hypothetical protein [Algoriphagus limi]